jgi:two-component system CheB/CheR fusion protein
VLDGWAEVEPGRRARVAVVASPVAPDTAPDEKPGPPEYFVISFEERGDFAPPAPSDQAAEGTESADELRRLRAELQRTIEELQTSNEELRASNEEVMSINEEFQAANEELETSREEMQSLNEELTTVNAQLRAKVEEHLAASSDLSSLLSSTDIAVLFLDTAFRIRRYTPAVRGLLDLIASDVGRPLAALARRFDDPQLDDDARAVLERLVPVEREVAAAGGRYYLRRILPYRTTDNRIDGVVVTFVDISARKKAEEALRASEEQFRRSVEDAPIPVIMYAEDGQVLQISRTWTELTGYTLADVPTFEAWLTRAYGPGADAVRAHMHDLFAGDRRTLGVDFMIRTRGGAERHWSFSASAPGSLRDGRQFVVGMAVDVTEQRLAHERAVQAERLAAIGQATTTLAHEGRNALQRAHACLSMLGFRLEGKPEAVDLAGRTRQALEDLQRLFDDIRGYAGPIMLDIRACDLGDVWREAWSQVLGRYPDRDARLEEDLGGTTLACEADRFRLGQMFANLFANALDACPDPVRVVVICRGTLLGDRPVLRVTVRDNGPGFNPEQRRHAFEPFQTTKAKGTGLGLAIVKRIVDAHGGTIALDDSPRGGAITLTLPLQQIETAAP